MRVPSLVNVFEYFSHSRNGLLCLGDSMGVALDARQSAKPVFAHLGGASHSGKSPFAMAMAKAMHPPLYPNGVDHNASIRILTEPDAGLPVLYHNFGNDPCHSKAAFDARLTGLSERHPDARVYIAANHVRHIPERHIYPRDGLGSDILDINIDFHKVVYERAHEEDDDPVQNPWARRLVVTVRDPQLCERLQWLPEVFP